MDAIHRSTLMHPRGASSILIGAGVAESATAEMAPWLEGRTVFVLSTPTLRRLYPDTVDQWLEPAARRVDLEVPDGEEAKTIDHAARLWQSMLASGGKRDSRLITFGGGTVGDLGGFVAACFLRGIAYAQVPTTLLAQVDASVGGKTAVDMPAGKNTIGAFHHPDWVVVDTRFAATLDPAERRSGLIEVIKMAFLLDPPLLALVERDLESLLAADPGALGPVVAGAVEAKRRIVEADPEEGDRRRLLNFGHTLGHAIESALGYRGLRHGEAVAYGMLFALRLAADRGLPPGDALRLVRLLGRLGLPDLPSLPSDRLLTLMAGDKKAREDGLVWVLPTRLGEGEMVPLAEDTIAARLTTFLSDPWRDRVR